MRAPVLLLAACLCAGTGAEAHAFLDSAAPAVGSRVAAAPAAVTLHFTEEVEPAFSTITVTDATGHRVDSGAPHVAGADATVFAVGLKPVPAGTYTVAWHVTAVDTHRTEGRFTFNVR